MRGVLSPRPVRGCAPIREIRIRTFPSAARGWGVCILPPFAGLPGWRRRPPAGEPHAPVPIQASEDLGRRQAHRSPHPAQSPPRQHVARVVRPFVDASDPDQQREGDDGQPHPSLGPPRAAPTAFRPDAPQVPDGRPDGDDRDGVGAGEAVARLVYELQRGGRPWPVEEDLEELRQGTRAEGDGEQHDPREAQPELLAPVGYARQSASRQGRRREQRLGREDGL